MTTQERFSKVFNTDGFEFFVRCKKCGNTYADMRFSPGYVYSEETSDPACLEIWCTNPACDNHGYQSGGD